MMTVSQSVQKSSAVLLICFGSLCSAQWCHPEETCAVGDSQAGSALLQKKHEINNKPPLHWPKKEQESEEERRAKERNFLTQRGEASKDEVAKEQSRVDEVPMSEDGWTEVVAECCEHTLDVYARRILEDSGFEICDEGCFNGFLPFYGCGLSETLANFKEHVEMNSKEECGCFALVDKCGEGGMPWQCVDKNGGKYDSSFHRRRICKNHDYDATETTSTTEKPAVAEEEEEPVIAKTTEAPYIEARDCKMPAGSSGYSVITKNDAIIHAHLVYTGMAIGGKLMDGTQSENAVVQGKVSYNSKGARGNWNFNGGQEQRVFSFDWVDFEWLAQNVKASSSGGYVVKVFTKGGTYNMDDALKDGQGEDNGKTLMVFNTVETVTLTKTDSGRQFGPSVLAPFSKVILKGEAGFIDGCVFAKSFGDWSSGANAGQLQMHGDCYKGRLECDQKAQ